MRELHPGGASLQVDEPDDALQHLDVRILVNAEVLRADAPVGGDRGRFRHHERCATDRARSKVNQMPLVGKPVVARVLAHGRDDDAVGKREAAGGERVE